MKINKIQDIKTFQNSKDYWEYNGAFSIELTPDADKTIIPSNVKVEGDMIYVQSGHIKQSVGAIQLYSGDQSFYFAYKNMKIIRDSNKNLLWVNYKYR